ncbi:hypothetical protein EG328_004070 [Venturia inaequalis]|uniref:RanBD1 domain-containing protein n=1 Tax=Venturia inaequalis TaxID=5025 RepID=A0A8H3ZJ56_VENIN|nr:hypothetical protein EG328_004070 [Venturia inaequalis]KAE9993806.1 hypothetical protein EG327_003055 [Venturia inaequalis]
MSVKRGAESYLTKDDVSGPRMHQGGPDDRSDPVKRATAAQLANRKIKAAKGRGARSGAGGTTARPVTSFGPSPSTPQPGLFSNEAQSFPPGNGAPLVGNGSPNVSFGGFGSVGANTGFAFSQPVPVSNPFANVSSSSTTNGASKGGFGFNFGGSQPAAAAPSTGIFSFGGNQQQAPNPFSSATPQAPSTGTFGSSTAPSSNTFGTSAASAIPAGGLFGSTNGGSTFGSTNGTGMFGSTSSTNQQPSGGSAFGQPPAEAKSEVPHQNFFGTPAPAIKSPFGQHNDDAMSTSPDASPQKGAHNPISNSWNKSLEVPANGVSSIATSNGEESPDRPHIEEEPRPNPFAMIPRAKSSEPPKPVKTPVNPFFNTEKKQEDEPAHTEDSDEMPRANPFASISRKAQSTPKPADPAPKPSFSQSSIPATSNIFGKTSTDPTSSLASSTNHLTPAKTSNFSPIVNSSIVKQPAIVEQSPIVGEDQPSRESNSQSFGSSTTKPSARFESAQPTQSTSSPTNIFGLVSKPTQATTAPNAIAMDSTTTARLAEIGTIFPQDRLGSHALSRHLSADFRSRVLAEHSLSISSAESGLDAEEMKYWVREHKQNRLNMIYKHFFDSQGKESNFEAMDLRPMMANYITLFEEIMVPIEGPLTTLIAKHGKEQGTRLYHQQNGSMPDESGKRKPGVEVAREDATPKKVRVEAPLPANVTQTPPPLPPPSQSSATANKFMDFLNKTDKPVDSSNSNAATKSPAPKPAVVEAPTFKMPTFAPTGNAMAKFGENAAKAAAAAKQKAKDEDYDSDDETEAEWERKYEEKMAAKAAELKKVQQNSGFGFKVNASSSTTSPSTNGGFGFKINKPATASSLAPPAKNGGFNFSRSASPAASATGSVFDTGRSNTPSGSGNIFGHLSTAGSDVEGSARGDADDEDSDEDDAQRPSTPKASNSQPNGKFGGFTESDDAPSDSATSGRSLFDRIEKRSEAPAPSTSGNMFGFPSSTEKSTPAPSGGMFGSRDESSERIPLAATAANEGGLFGFGAKPATAGPAITGGLFGFGTNSSPPAPAKEGGLFGFGSQSTTSSTGDQTWKPDSPIKFNGSSTEAPKFSFVASTPKTAPSTGFSFSPIAPTPSGATTATAFSGFGTPGSSLFGAPKSSASLFVPSGSSSVLPSGATSRATTPGVSDVSGAETGGEQEETSNDPQSDLIGMEAAKKGHDLLFESEKVKASRYDVDPTGKKPAAWATQGVGPIAVLKDQATGVTKILMKKVPNGGIVINTRLMASMTYQQIAKRVRFGVIDPATSKMEQWIVQVSSEDEAKKFVEVCDAHKNQ